MPSQRHEALLLLFRNRPELAPELLRDALHVELPTYSEARIESADLTEVRPVEHRADLVVLLYRGKPVLGIVVEVQLSPDPDKRFSWPCYATGLRDRIRCPVCLLVVTVSDSLARWATRPIDLGGGNRFVPLVLGPSGVPEIIDPEVAREDPELAVLSAMAHGRDADTDKVLRIANAAAAGSIGLDAARAKLYCDLAARWMGPAAREALRSMDPAKYEYQSEFARRYVAEGIAVGEARGRAEGVEQGRAEGEARGRAELLLKQLRARFGILSESAEGRVRSASLDELDLFAERVLTADTLADVIGSAGDKEP